MDVFNGKNIQMVKIFWVFKQFRLQDFHKHKKWNWTPTPKYESLIYLINVKPSACSQIYSKQGVIWKFKLLNCFCSNIFHRLLFFFFLLVPPFLCTLNHHHHITNLWFKEILWLKFTNINNDDFPVSNVVSTRLLRNLHKILSLPPSKFCKVLNLRLKNCCKSFANC